MVRKQFRKDHRKTCNAIGIQWRCFLFNIHLHKMLTERDAKTFVLIWKPSINQSFYFQFRIFKN